MCYDDLLAFTMSLLFLFFSFMILSFIIATLIEISQISVNVCVVITYHRGNVTNSEGSDPYGNLCYSS